MDMKRMLMGALLMASACFVAACSSTTVVTLKDGRQIQAADKPRLDEETGFYYFTQPNGKETAVNKEEVSSIGRK